MAIDVDQPLEQFLMEWSNSVTPTVETVLQYRSMEEKEYMRGVVDTLTQLKSKVREWNNRFDPTPEPKPPRIMDYDIKDIQ